MEEEEKEKEKSLAPRPNEPLQPAWDDLICLQNAGKNYRVQIAALQTTLQAIVRAKPEGESSKFMFLSFPPYEPPNPQPLLRDADFNLRAQCAVHLDEDAGSDAVEADDTDMTESICLFLYEVRTIFDPVDEAPDN